MKLLKRRILLAALIALWSAEFIGTHLPLPRLPRIPGKDKTLHLLAYFFIGILFLSTLLAYRVKFSKAFLAMLLIFPAYAAFDEITQPLVNRYADFADWRADMTGALAAAAIVWVCVKIKTKLNIKDPRS